MSRLSKLNPKSSSHNLSKDTKQNARDKSNNMGNSTSMQTSEEAMLAFTEYKEKRNSRKKKTKTSHKRSHGKKCKSDPLHDNQFLDICDLQDIHSLITELKRDKHGQRLLDEFVDYQSGKSSKKPQLLNFVCDESDTETLSEDFPVKEIRFGAKSA